MSYLYIAITVLAVVGLITVGVLGTFAKGFVKPAGAPPS
ncbi:hypothetical protein PPL_04796 [Heterostelium album PN500]|uniref:Uncharacterized protein n=1 Tax=Heterostelium pallidum (strain ATCC 26659 / Pp 5 / PN500) TaxID=670386 RepID=D3B8K3_HETP5|nr:hypothetical protein PPL_04796 [Heterostelium album PN500]EFA82371.1 hypothetical protein PPL_04796 [Heterostelium album PN500]|eukprot:XP_020434488.1 hypothetical protein PPL_04796 [Heterostelium album PN500]